MRPRALWLGVLVALVPLAGSARSTAAQPVSRLGLAGPAGAVGIPIPVTFHRGYAAVPFTVLERLGWTVLTTAAGGEAWRGSERVRVRGRTPFFHWGDALLQLAQEPYRFGDDLWVPLQLLSDFLPERMPDDYAFRGDGRSLEVRTLAAWTPVISPSSPRSTARLTAPAALAPRPEAPAAARPPACVVVIDPGHGGSDPGARGPSGLQEKEVTLRLGLALARQLEQRPDLEVHLTRTTDRLVPPWERGERANEVRGNRPGIFISLHANSGTSLSAQGFETYFLSEARTEHERRVAALENASVQVGGYTPTAADPVLAGILGELRNLDTQHWSALLAELVQEEMGSVHPGPNRGVKQGPLAVITNAVMPAVLVEVGFISNRAEERLLANADFQEDAARAIARAVDQFFDRYPPSTSSGGTTRP